MITGNGELSPIEARPVLLIPEMQAAAGAIDVPACLTTSERND